jgi:hypothetical protein
MKPKFNEKGQALIMIAIGAVVLFAFTALAVDGSMVFSQKRQAQNAADAAALASALAKTRSNTWKPEGFDSARINGFNNDTTTNEVFVESCVDVTCPGLPANADKSEYVYVKIIIHVTTYFTRVVGRDTVTQAVEAVARSVPGDWDELVYGNSVVALSPSECSAVWSHGNADTDIIGGGIFSNSECSTAFRQNGSGNISVTGGGITAVGGASYSSGHVSPAPTVNPAAKIPYPPPITMPNPVCQGAGVKTGDTLSPGSYSGTFPPNGVKTLLGGVYCLNGDFRLNGGDVIWGEDVVFVMESGDIVWNGNSEAHLSAPDEGPFAGLLIYVRFDPSDPFANRTTITINGTSDMTLTGSILAPASNVNILGTGGVDGFNCQIIGYTVEFGGTSGATVRYDDSKNYDAQIPPRVELVK